jgi:D-tyrosyl-tRNA(Tyr) deacylase
MRILLQRVQKGSVHIGGRAAARIGPGLVILVGIGVQDSEAQVSALANKVANLRIFEDQAGKMNLSIQDTGGEVIIVSQFTLYADTRKGRRPSFIGAARPEQASELVDSFARKLSALGIPTQTGQFGAHMQVEIVNDGPVTIWMESDPS